MIGFNGGRIENCINYADYCGCKKNGVQYGSTYRIAGIAGENSSNGVVNNCRNNGKQFIENSSENNINYFQYDYIGDIVGINKGTIE